MEGLFWVLVGSGKFILSDEGWWWIIVVCDEWWWVYFWWWWVEVDHGGFILVGCWFILGGGG